MRPRCVNVLFEATFSKDPNQVTRIKLAIEIHIANRDIESFANPIEIIFVVISVVVDISRLVTKSI